MLEFHRLGLGEVLAVRGHVQTIEPCFLCRACTVEEQNVGSNRRIGRKNTTRHTDDGMQVEFGQQFLFDVDLGVIGTEQESVGQNHRHTTILLQTIHDDRHEKVSSFAACKIIWKVILYIRLFTAAVGRVHKNDIKLIVYGVVKYIFEKGIVMVHTRNIKSVQKEIGDTKHIRELLFLNTINRIAVFFCICCTANLFLQFFQPACDKSARTAGKVRHGFTDLRLNHLCHKVSYSTRSIEFTGRTCTLKFLQNGFIDFTECMAFLIVGKVKFVNDIDDLTEKNTVFHVLICIGKSCLDDRFFDGGFGSYFNTFDEYIAIRVLNIFPLQYREKCIVYKVKKLIPCHCRTGFIICRPILPTTLIRNN